MQRNGLSRSPARHIARGLRFESLEPRHLLAADMVLTWNEHLLQAVRDANTPPPIASRAMAIVHAAIYDAVNAIDRTHAPYAVDRLALPTTSREAAVAAAAHATLSSLFPAQQATFDAHLAAALATVPDGPAEDLGVVLGSAVAAEMLALRAGDGSTGTSGYAHGSDAGNWIPTPPGFANPLLPHWGDVAPFAMLSSSQFAPAGIPLLTSVEYAAAFNEVKELGSDSSTTRTADQTAIALFWANGAGTATPPGHLNMLAHVVAEAQGNSLSDNARLFAMLNIAMADAAIMCWDVKYETDFWRPVTAIRAADTDGNPGTEADPDWTPLIATPPFPTYVSGHSSFSGAAAAVLGAFFGRDDIAFTLPSEDLNVAARSFTSLSQAAQESADSRLYGGIHFRFDNEDGLTAGAAIGQYVAANFLQPQGGGAVGLVGDVLVIVGTDARDHFRVDQTQDQIVVFRGGRKWASFAVGEVGSIVIDARGGNDFIQLTDRLRIDATIYGGDGNDILFGGRGNDVLYGGAGNDLIFGGRGNDSLYGEDGNDRLFGLFGDDLLDGGPGKNKLIAGPAKDDVPGKAKKK